MNLKNGQVEELLEILFSDVGLENRQEIIDNMLADHSVCSILKLLGFRLTLLGFRIEKGDKE